MNNVKIEIEVPELLFQYVDYNNPEYKNKIKKLMVYDLVKEGKISFGKAAEILDTDKVSFITDLGKMGIPYFDNDIEEVIEDVKTIEKFLEEK